MLLGENVTECRIFLMFTQFLQENMIGCRLREHGYFCRMFVNTGIQAAHYIVMLLLMVMMTEKTETAATTITPIIITMIIAISTEKTIIIIIVLQPLCL